MVATPVATVNVAATSTPAPVVEATPTATPSPEPTVTAAEPAAPQPTVAQEPAPVPPAPEAQVEHTDARAPRRAKVDRRRARAQQKRGVAREKRKARLAEARRQPGAQTNPQVPSTPVTTYQPQPTRVVAVRTRAGKTRLGPARHLIQPGECLSVIAARYGLSWERLAVLNGVEGPDYVIHAGDTLVLY